MLQYLVMFKLFSNSITRANLLFMLDEVGPV